MVDQNLVRPTDLWYVIGIIVSDGNLSLDGRHLNITSKDLVLIERIKAALFLTNKISMKARGGETVKKYGFLQFGDAKFYRYLLTIGLTPKKSITLGKISVPEQYFPDFLRGVIDGDGNIHRWNHPQNGGEQWELRITSAAPIFSKWLFDTTQKYFKVKGILVSGKDLRHNRNPRFVIKFGKMAGREIVRRYYYQSALVLPRK